MLLRMLIGFPTRRLAVASTTSAPAAIRYSRRRLLWSRRHRYGCKWREHALRPSSGPNPMEAFRAHSLYLILAFLISCSLAVVHYTVRALYSRSLFAFRNAIIRSMFECCDFAASAVMELCRGGPRVAEDGDRLRARGARFIRVYSCRVECVVRNLRRFDAAWADSRYA